MAIKTFTTSEVLTAADTNTYLANSGLQYVAGATVSASNVFDVTGFSSSFLFYELRVNVTASTGCGVNCVLYSGATPRSTNYYGGIAYVAYNGATGVYSTSNNSGNFYMSDVNPSPPTLWTAQLTGVGLNSFNIVTRGWDNANSMATTGGFTCVAAANSYDKIRFTATNSALISGSWSLMGVRKP